MPCVATDFDFRRRIVRVGLQQTVWRTQKPNGLATIGRKKIIELTKDRKILYLITNERRTGCLVTTRCQRCYAS